MAKQYPSQKNSHEPTNVLVKFSYMKTLHFETAIFLVLVRPQRLVYKQKKQKKSLRSSKYKNIKTSCKSEHFQETEPCCHFDIGRQRKWYSVR